MEPMSNCVLLLWPVRIVRRRLSVSRCKAPNLVPHDIISMYWLRSFLAFSLILICTWHVRRSVVARFSCRYRGRSSTYNGRPRAFNVRRCPICLLVAKTTRSGGSYMDSLFSFPQRIRCTIRPHALFLVALPCCHVLQRHARIKLQQKRIQYVIQAMTRDSAGAGSGRPSLQIRNLATLDTRMYL